MVEGCRSRWENEQIPTVYDIAQFMNGEENNKMNSIFDFFDNKEEFLKMANRTHHKYNQDESTNFIKKVQAANCDEISLSGYFYKLLMASADDFRIIENDCGSEGQEFNVNSITKEEFEYRVKSMYIEEFNDNCNMDYDQFKDSIEFGKNNEYIKNDIIHVRNPKTCKCAKEHGICKKCAGELPLKIKNIGTFTALMVTEHITQNCLSSMNKGIQQNINDALLTSYKGNSEWNDIINWIDSIVTDLENNEVQSRYYEISLLSRIRRDWDNNGEYFVSSMKTSINNSGNIFGQYIFTPNMKNFQRMIDKKEFEDNSLKLQIAMNEYEE